MNRAGRKPLVAGLSGVLLTLLSGLVFPLQTVQAETTNPTLEPWTWLVEDFSGMDGYTKDQLANPFHAQAGLPLWCTPAICPQTPAAIGDQGFHTNNRGYYTSGWNDSLQTNNFVDHGIRSGSLYLTWNSRPYTIYWYSALALAGQYAELTPYYTVLKFRVRGEAGGENFRIKIDTTSGPSRELNVSSYVTLKPNLELGSDWQTVTIPLADFALPSGRGTAIVLLFGAPRAGRATETVYVDDFVFEQDPAFRPAADGVVKPASTGAVRTSGRSLLVNGRTFVIRGVGYNPTPIGQTPDWGTYQPFTQAIVQRDFPQIKAMGANTVRVWNRFDYEQIDRGNGVLDRTYTNVALLRYGADPNGIKVCAGFWVPYEISMANEWAKDRLAESFQQFVTARKSEPSLLMWVIGNENNVWNGYDWRWYQFANRLAKIAYQVEGAAYHPAAIVEADLGTIGNANLGSDDAHLNYFNILGVNAYRGKSWDAFYTDAKAKTQRPIWLSEFGIDAWRSNSPTAPEQGTEDQAAQADYDVKIWLECYRNRSAAIGATVLEYSDEWWKSHKFAPSELGAHLVLHDYKGFNFALVNPAALPDGYMNEEWWGIMAVQKSTTGPDRMIPRQVFNELYSNTIGGRVRNDSNAPVSGVEIRAKRGTEVRSTLTDSYGLYAFTKLQTGPYTVTMFRNGLQASQTSVTLSAGTALADFVHTAKLPDLIVSAVSTATASVARGGSVPVSNSVKNQGTGSAGTFRVGFVLSPDAAYGGTGDVAISTNRYVSSLAIGATSTGTTNVVVPAATPVGYYYVCARADSWDTVYEGSVESNNTRCTATRVQVR